MSPATVQVMPCLPHRSMLSNSPLCRSPALRSCFHHSLQHTSSKVVHPTRHMHPAQLCFTLDPHYQTSLHRESSRMPHRPLGLFWYLKSSVPTKARSVSLRHFTFTSSTLPYSNDTTTALFCGRRWRLAIVIVKPLSKPHFR